MKILSGRIDSIVGLSSVQKRILFEYVCIGFGTLLFGVLKLYYKFADNDSVFGLIQPTNYLYSIIENSTWVYIPELGFFHNQLNVVIDKSCSGGNFFILCVCLIYFTGLVAVTSWRSVFKLILISGFVAYLYTILINVSRISILSKVNQYGIGIEGWTHEAIGSFVYVSGLVILFLLQSVVIQKLKINE